MEEHEGAMRKVKLMEQAEIAIIGGTGLQRMAGLDNVHTLDVETPFGSPSSPISIGTMGERRVAFLSRHGPAHNLLPTEVPYRANAYALRMLGVMKAFGISAVGSLQENLPPRTLVVPDQFIDRTRTRVGSFFGEGLVAHVSLADPFSPVLRQCLLRAARELGEEIVDGGTYLCMEGPQLSTRAESRLHAALGCAVVGMTVATEARLLREAEIAYASVNLVTDYDAWRPLEAGVCVADILAIVKENASRGTRLVRQAIVETPTGSLPENHALRHALVTPLESAPPAVRARLAALFEPRRPN